MSEINYDYINEYLRAIQPKSPGLLGEIEELADKTGLPIVQPEVAKLIRVLLSLKKPKNILEIGTAVAYSAIMMSEYLQPEGKIVTLERFDIMQEAARKNIKEANLEDTITMIEGDAGEILPTLEGNYDVIFMDAAKGQYHQFFPHCMRLMNEGGLLIADNVLHKGMVAKSRYAIPRRQRTIHKRMRNFLWTITHHPELETSILPMGDGVAVCYKVKKSVDK